VANIQGTVDTRFERVRETLAELLDAPHELGAALSIVIDGRTVVDVWGGFTDRAREKPWARDTLANVYSTTKGWTSMCVHHLVDHGKLDLDAPVASYWPEFAQADKEGIPVRWLLDHRAGLPAIRRALPAEALFDWNAMTNALAAETPWWEPGKKHGYHAITFGDAHIGLSPTEDARCAELRYGKPDPTSLPTLVQYMMSNPDSMTTRAFTNPPSIAMSNLSASREYRGAEIPAINGHATARAIASLYGTVARGELLSKESVARASTESARGPDETLHVEMRYGLGFWLSLPGDELGPNEGSFGHPGNGGSVGFADPTTKLGFAYVPNRLGTSIFLDPRGRRLIDAAYAALQ
jgi:CubicO group peptidase (beta-lactamase class C family)